MLLLGLLAIGAVLVCPHTYTRADFHHIAHRVYDTAAVATPFERRTLHRVIRCQRQPSRLLLRLHLQRYRRHHTGLIEIRRLTPYDCGRSGRWAIPCAIINCESGFRWDAYNPSGARGPYQLLGWPVPWPVRSLADQLAHHRMAARLWNGGLGRSNWVC